MKKWMAMTLIGACAAGLAMAEETVPWYKKLFTKSADETAPVVEPAPEAAAPVAAPEMPRMQRREGLSEEQRPKLTPEQMEKLKARKAQMQHEGAGDRPHPQINPQQMERMKAQHEALMKLGEAARAETDPVKKEALIAELRTKLTEVSDRIQVEAKKRLEQAGKEMKNLEKRIADYEQNKSSRIEEQVQRILAGEPLKGFDGKRPQQPGGAKNKKAPAPAVAE